MELLSFLMIKNSIKIYNYKNQYKIMRRVRVVTRKNPINNEEVIGTLYHGKLFLKEVDRGDLEAGRVNSNVIKLRDQIADYHLFMFCRNISLSEISTTTKY